MLWEQAGKRSRVPRGVRHKEGATVLAALGQMLPQRRQQRRGLQQGLVPGVLLLQARLRLLCQWVRASTRTTRRWSAHVDRWAVAGAALGRGKHWHQLQKALSHAMTH